MKINCGEIARALEAGGEEAYCKLTQLAEMIEQIKEDWRDKNFVEVRVFNHDGNITPQLRKAFPKYDIWWEGDPGYCGENIILVPGNDWNEELKAKIAEFDSEAGHHKETQREWKLKEDVKLPYDLEYDIENWKRDILNRTGKMPEVVQIPNYAFHQWPFQRYYNSAAKYFDEVQTVKREYDVELTVNDRRKYVSNSSSEDYVIEI